MTRFIMTIEDAVKLIFKSISIMKGKEIFIFKSMYSIKILELAEVLKDYYKKKYKRISISEIGLATKEKFSEMLMTKEESKVAEEKNDMFVIDFKKKILNTKHNTKRFIKLDSNKVKFLKKREILKLLKLNNLIK